MAISLVGVVKGTSTSGANVTLTLPSMLQNDLVLVWGSHNGSASGISVSTSGYTTFIDTDTTRQTIAAYKKMGASPDASVTLTGAGGSPDPTVFLAMVFRGVDTTNPIDATSVLATGTNSQPNSASITTVTNGAAVISAVADNTFSGVTAPTGYLDAFTEAKSETGTSIQGAMAWKSVATAGAENPSSWGNFSVISTSWIAATIALRPQAAGTFGDAVFSFTGTGTATFIPASRFICTGTGTASFVGQPLSANPAPFAMTGNAAVAFEGYGSAQGPFDMTGSGSASFVGDRIYMSDVRLIIETGKAAVTIR